MINWSKVDWLLYRPETIWNLLSSMLQHRPKELVKGAMDSRGAGVEERRRGGEVEMDVILIDIAWKSIVVGRCKGPEFRGSNVTFPGKSWKGLDDWNTEVAGNLCLPRSKGRTEA